MTNACVCVHCSGGKMAIFCPQLTSINKLIEIKIVGFFSLVKLEPELRHSLTDRLECFSCKNCPPTSPPKHSRRISAGSGWFCRISYILLGFAAWCLVLGRWGSPGLGPGAGLLAAEEVRVLAAGPAVAPGDVRVLVAGPGGVLLQGGRFQPVECHGVLPVSKLKAEEFVFPR